MKRRRIYIASILIVCIYLLPQNIYSDNIEKANRYYEKYDYKYAIEIYEKIMAKKPSLEVAQKLANSYRFINNTEASEKAYARVLTFPGFDPLNYKYYADALKQNGKFEAAKANYILYSQADPLKSEEALRMANSADAARMWSENPDPNVVIDNAIGLNTEYAEFSPIKSANGFLFVSDRWFSQGSAGKTKKHNDKVVYGWTGNPYLKLYAADMTIPEAPKIGILPPQINNELHNASAVLTADYDTIYFTRTELTKKAKDKIAVGRKSIFFSVLEGTQWRNPERLSFPGYEDISVQHPALSPQGDILYFASNMTGGMGGMDIYASRKGADGRWSSPVNCGPGINTSEDEVFPYVRGDGQFYFSSKGHIGMGGLDIFTSTGSYNQLSAAENLKYPMNSSKDDFGVVFTDNHTGFLSSNRKGGRGLDDIYQFTIGSPVIATGLDQKNDLFYSIEGLVIENGTGLPMPNVMIHLLNTGTGQEKTTLSDIQGKFNFDLEPGMDYIIKGDMEKYFAKEGHVSTKNLTESTIFTVRVELEKAEDAYLVRLKNIYYDFNKWDIRKDAIPDLNSVISFAGSMPDVRIELRSHTDARGKASYNQWLSQKRAQSALNYLMSKGVSSARLSAVGLGESELLNRCLNNVKCSEKDHQLNRRTEFKVTRFNNKSPLASIPLASAR